MVTTSSLLVAGASVVTFVSAAAIQVPLEPLDHSQNYKFNPLLHLPGTSPYFDAVGFGLNHKAPTGCHVTAASYLVRHGAIYSNDEEYEDFIKPFLWKLEKHRGNWSGPLEFLNQWSSPILEDKLEELTPQGARDAQRVGEHLVKRYPELVNSTKRIIADQKSRCFDTAANFVKGFPNVDDIEVVKYDKDKKSMNSLTPHKSCKAFNKEPGKKEMKEFVSQYAPLVAARLEAYTAFKLEDFDVVAMQSICGYESAINGEKSPLCDIFTDNEWMAYEYAWDMKYAYMVGPLNKLSPYLGYPWLQAQSDMFKSIDTNGSTPGNGWPDGQRFFLSFTHREVPPFIATILGIFNSTFESTAKNFPTDRIVWTRAWRMSDLIPFLGHVGLEKLSCDRHGARGEYVRVIANTAPRPMPECQDGPGASCPFEAFRDIIFTAGKEYADYKSVCEPKKKKSKKSKSKAWFEEDL